MAQPADDTVETIEVVAFAPEEIMVTDEMMPTDLVVVEEPMAPAAKKDYMETQDLGDFMEWITGKMANLPPHSGKTTAGCERVIAHLKMLDKEISKAISRDVDCMLDDQAVEKFRKDIRKMIKKLEKRHKEINEAYDADDDKFAAAENEIVKNADSTWKCPECGKEITPGDAEHQARHNAMEHGKVASLEKEALEPPYVRHRGNKWVVLDKHNGRVLSTHDTEEKAKGSLAAMHMHGDDDGRYEVKEVSAADDQIEAHACACKVEKKADDNCPTCNIKLWKAAEGLYECISCDAVFERPITKEAGTPKIQLVMTPLERALTGILINGYVSQGKQIEPAFAELKKAYKLTEREELSIMQLLLDMGYPTARNFMGMPHSNSVEFATNYPA